MNENVVCVIHSEKLKELMHQLNRKEALFSVVDFLAQRILPEECWVF